MSAFVLIAVVGGSVQASIAACDGRLVYALDDAYIHLSMARTLAETGTWGISPNESAFASSSPAWTLLLASAYRVGLTSVWMPLCINVVAALALLVIVDASARRLLATDRARTWLLLSLVFVTPVPALVLSGMEALTQVTAVLAFVAVAARANRVDESVTVPSAWLLALLAALVSAFRYESTFVVFSAALVCATRKRWRLAIAACAGASVPIVAYGCFALQHGGWWLPTSIVLKADPPHIHSLTGVTRFFADKGLTALFTQPPLPVLLTTLLLLSVAYTWRNRDLTGDAEGWVLVSTGAILVHIHLVNYEWLYRYKAYLVATGLSACAFGLSRLRALYGIRADDARRPVTRYVALMLLAAAFTGPLALMGFDALARGIRGTRSIYLQQYQMARLLSESDERGAVVLNDVGAVAYYSRRPIVDLFGLASQRVAEQRRLRRLDTAEIDRIVRVSGAKIAILYAPRFKGQLKLPPRWRPVAQWASEESATVDQDTVTLYATSVAYEPAVRARVSSFILPSGVTVEPLQGAAQSQTER